MADFTDREIQVLLCEVDQRDLVIALSGSDGQVEEIQFRIVKQAVGYVDARYGGGIEATQRIRSLEKPHGKHTLIVGLTANAIEGTREHCIAAGMDEYMPKPIKCVPVHDMLTQSYLDSWFDHYASREECQPAACS